MRNGWPRTPQPVVRAAVASSPMTPVALSKTMVRDRDRRVRGGALARLPLSPEERANLHQLRQRLRDLEEQRDLLPPTPAPSATRTHRSCPS